MSFYGNSVLILKEDLNNDPIEYIIYRINKILWRDQFMSQKIRVNYLGNKWLSQIRDIKKEKMEVAGVLETDKDDCVKYLKEIKSLIIDSNIYGNYISTNEKIIPVERNYFKINIIYIKDIEKFKNNFDKEKIDIKIDNFEKKLVERFTIIRKEYNEQEKLYRKFITLVNNKKFDEARKIIDLFDSDNRKESCLKYLDSKIKEYNSELEKSKPIVDKNGNQIIVYNNRFNVYEFVKKYNNKTIYLYDENDLKNENFLNSLDNFDTHFSIFSKMLKSEDYKNICKRLIKVYFDDLEDFLDESKLKSLGDINSNISKCILGDIYYNPIDSSIIFGISIQLVNNYTGVASCAMTINGNNYNVKINDIYCD